MDGNVDYKSGVVGRNDDREIMRDIRQDTLTSILTFCVIGSWSGIALSGLFMQVTPASAVLLWLAFEAVCIASLWLRLRNVVLSIYTLIIGMLGCSIVAVPVFSTPIFLYFSSVIPLVASILLRRRSALVITIIGSIGLLNLQGISMSFQDTIGPAVLWWFTLFCGFAAFSSLYHVLQMSLAYQTYAVERMDEARAHRAQLVQLTKVLQETRQDLEMRNIQLRHVSVAAEEARSLKAQFAANVSHELRTPINLIVGFAEMIISGQGTYGEALPSVYWLDMNTIYRNARHLQSLINDVLDISQIEAGRMSVIKEYTDPREVILEAVALVRDSILHKGLTFTVQIPDTLPMAWIDRLRVRQVVLNLLGNAIRFTDQGSITVRAYAEETLLYICVADTGIGIPAHELKRVFEEFHQIEGSLSRQHGGSGLGLTLSKQFVELHGGGLRVESEGVPGKGSGFTVTLPLEASPALAMTSSGTPAVMFNPEARYFVVLDEDTAISQIFERHTIRHRAVGVQSEDDACRLIKRIAPSALVVDSQRIVEGDLTALVEATHTPLIRCPLPSAKRRMKALGLAEYLVKPISAATLGNALHRLNLPIQTILIVGDDQDVVRLYTHLLQNMASGYQVRKAYSELEALEIIRHSPPDIMILDIPISDTAGSEVITRMKADPTLKEIPIILVSAYDAVDAVAPLSRDELRLSKPFQPAELVRCVEALVDAITPSNVQATSGVPAVPAVS